MCLTHAPPADGKLLCLTSDDGSASLLETKAYSLVRRLQGLHSAAIGCCCFSPDSSRLCLGSKDKTATLIEVKTGLLVRQLDNLHDGEIRCCCFSPDGTALCLGSEDFSACLVDVVSRKDQRRHPLVEAVGKRRRQFKGPSSTTMILG